MVVDQGTAALGAAIIAAMVAVVTLLISIRTERNRVRLEAGLSITHGIEQERRNLLYSQLSEFYDPILALLSINRRIFERIGPNADVRWDQSYPEEETANVWSKL